MSRRRRSSQSPSKPITEQNPRTQGRYIVVNGVEGSGKDTQILRLAQRLRQAGIPVHVTREPGGADLTARVLRQITQDPSYHINTKTEVLLYNASRAQTLDLVRDMVERGVWVISNYNYLMTLAVQYYARNDGIAYDDINTICEFAVGDMQGDIPILLDLPPEVGRQRKDKYAGGERFDNLNVDFMAKIRDGLLTEAKKRGHVIIDADQTIEQVESSIWEAVEPFVSGKVPNRPPSYTVAASKVSDIIAEKKIEVPKVGKPIPTAGPLVKKVEGQPTTITAAGKAWLNQHVTNTTDNVYAFKDTISPITVAAAMARLSRRGDDMRVTMLDEFAEAADKDDELLHRVITAYGDDSVQQLVGIHLVVENASNLLTKKLEWGRLASYLEQSTRYIYFDQKDERGNFKYFTPLTLSAPIAKLYEETLDKIFDTYSQLVHKLTEHVQKHSDTPEAERDGAWRSACRAQACDAVRAVLPVATKSTVGIFASAQAAESLIMHLQSDPFEEAQAVGQQLLDEARKVIPVFLERADRPDRGGAWVAYRSETAQMVSAISESLNIGYSADLDPVKLVDVWPKSELDLLPHMLFEHTEGSLSEIEQAVSTWTYEQKVKAFSKYMGKRLNRRHRPGRALEIAHYSFELVCDYGIFRDLQRHRIVDAMQWQALTPRYGYEVPELVEQANLVDDFQSCFDMSMELHSKMQAAGFELEAQYATLLGHKMRWKVMYNAREAFHLHELRTAPQGHPGYRKLVKEMHEKVAEHHPLLAEAMQFVNQDEDPALTRLAAERYTQWKLQQSKTRM